MNEEVKDKWITALRSGDYNQDVDALKTEKGYCCLGVLCEIAVQEDVISPGVSTSFGEYEFDGETALLPKSVADWAGLDSANPSVVYEEVQVPISDPNDANVPFTVIADLIEEQL